MSDPAAPARLQVVVAYSPRAGLVVEVPLVLTAGDTVARAVRASGLLERHPEIELAHAGIGVWGRHCRLDTPLRDRDRVELYRPLTVDPKEARRLRYRSQRDKGIKPRGT